MSISKVSNGATLDEIKVYLEKEVKSQFKSHCRPLLRKRDIDILTGKVNGLVNSITIQIEKICIPIRRRSI